MPEALSPSVSGSRALRSLLGLTVCSALCSIFGAAPVAAAPADAPPTLTATASAPSTAAQALDGDCPLLTDSVTRLYSAYFLRSPDTGGFAYWVDEYSSGRRNLELISAFFAASPEFQARYGALDEAGFVRLIYRNVLDRVPDPLGLEFWTGRLTSGEATRGEVMLFFSESEEYVSATDTTAPMAGYLRSYPVGTSFECGHGRVGSWTTTAPGHSDLFVEHRGPGSTDIRIRATGYAISYRVISDTYYAKNIRHRRPSTIDVAADDPVHWAIVSYPGTMPADRPGWGF